VSLDAGGLGERSHRDGRIHAVSGVHGNELETSGRVDDRPGRPRGLPIDELQARVTRSLGGSVRRSDLATPGRLEKLLRHHVNRGELELVDGAWRLTPLGRQQFGGLLDPTFAQVEERAAA